MNSRRLHSNGGFTLPELLIAMVLGVTLIGGALQLFNTATRTYRNIEAIASLEERASFALQAIATDIQLAGFQGTTNDAGKSPIPTTAHCQGRDVSAWALRSEQAISATTNGMDAPCRPHSANMADSDSFTVWHRAAHTALPTKQMHSWYVDRESSLAGQPSLRRFTLLPNGSIQNQEIIPGIDKLRITLGVDRDGDAIIDGFIMPGLAPAAKVLAVQVRLRVRASLREPGQGADGYRRLTAGRLFFLRNQLMQQITGNG